MLEDAPITAALFASALRVADRAVVADIEAEAQRVNQGQMPPVYDISAMVDEREHSPLFVDMNTEAIAYGIARGLLEMLPTPPLRVRVLRMPT